MKVQFLHELVEYVHGHRPKEVKSYIMEQITETVDNNKGHFWELALEKAMTEHTTLLGRNAVGRDFTDNSDAKFATFYRKSDGVFEASVGNIKTKIGHLRVCLCLPGENYHRVFFLLIPNHAFQRYTKGSDALKFTIRAGNGNITGPLTDYRCSFDEVTKKLP